MKEILRVSDSSTGSVTHGLGWNWFDFLGMGGHYARTKSYPLRTPALPELDDSEGWSALWTALDDLKPQFIRFGLPPDPHYDVANECVVTDTVHIRRLHRLHEWTSDHDCEILLDTFVIPSAFEFPVPDQSYPSDEFIVMAARDNDAYAKKFVAPLLKAIVIDRGIDTIKYFNPVNEPMIYGVYRLPDGDDRTLRAHYVDMYRAIDTALRRVEIRDRIGLVGIDGIGNEFFPLPELISERPDFTSYVDLLALHYYQEMFDWMEARPGSWYEHMCRGVDVDTARMVRLARSRGLEITVAEVGSHVFGTGDGSFGDPAGRSRHENALLSSELVIRALNAGVTGALFWCLFNPHDIDGWSATLHLRDGAVIPEQHPYYAYRLLSRTIRRGDRVYPLRTVAPQEDHRAETGSIAYVHGTMVENEDRTAIILVNDSWTRICHVDIDLGEHITGSNWIHRTKDAARMAAEETVTLDPDTVQLHATLAPMSLHVFCTM